MKMHTEFVSEIIDNPESYTTYQIQLTGECLLAILLNELISNSYKQLEKDDIERIEVGVPLISYLRIKEVLNYIEYDKLSTNLRRISNNCFNDCHFLTIIVSLSINQIIKESLFKLKIIYISHFIMNITRLLLFQKVLQLSILYH